MLKSFWIDDGKSDIVTYVEYRGYRGPIFWCMTFHRNIDDLLPKQADSPEDETKDHPE